MQRVNDRDEPESGQRSRWFGLGLASALVAGGCTASGGGGSPAASTATNAVLADLSSFGITECGTYSGTGCAPESQRVDTTKPSFSHPTNVTNPLYPISTLRSVVLVGQVEGQPFRSETTLLPETRMIEWDGQMIETLVSQYTAYRNGRIEEVAIDRYAQADDGSVWYFGEDVVDYKDGNVATTEGTWLAGKEGPPAMIMPGKPAVGDVFRAENVTGIVFEQVVVKDVGKTVQGPSGPIAGAIVGEELHLDETTEEKIFAPGYGEFSTGAGQNLEALAVSAPTESLPPEPAELNSLTTAASGMLGSVTAGDWEAAAATLRRMNASWDALHSEGQPPLIAERLSGSLVVLAREVDAHRAVQASQAAIDTAQWALALELQYRPPAEVDRNRFELWTHQILVHAAAGDRAGVSGDVATLEWIRDRLTGTLDPAGTRELDSRLGALRVAADAGELEAAADHAARLGERLRSLRST